MANERKEYDAKVNENGKAYLRKSSEMSIAQLDLIIRNLTFRRDTFAALVSQNPKYAAVVAEAEAEIAETLGTRAEIEAILVKLNG